MLIQFLFYKVKSGLLTSGSPLIFWVMRIISRFRWPTFALLLLLGSCRGQQAAFRFQAPGPRAVASRLVASAKAVPTSATMLLPPTSTTALRDRNKEHAIPFRTIKARQAPRVAPRNQQHATRTAAAVTAVRGRQPRDEGEGNPWLLALGIVLVVGAVAAGLLIGGGAGLLVGIAGSLLGYYFLAKGILGPHAWLEIGQELFQL